MSASRYRSSPELTWRDQDGRPVRYLAPRILPQPGATDAAPVAAVQADEVDRLDLVAHRVLGDAEQAWRIADANAAMDPLALCRRVGATLRLPGSGA